MSRFAVPLLLSILVFTAAYETLFVIGPSYFGDDTVYTAYANMAAHGMFTENTGDEFSVRILNIYPIALFYWLFGVGIETTAAWATLSFLGSLVVAFYIGRLLYNEYVGLLAALVFSFFPLFAILSGTPCPNIPEAFLTGMVMLSILIAQKDRSAPWYFATGVFLVLAPLATQSSGIILLVFSVYIVIELARKNIKVDKHSINILYGIAAAMVPLLLFNFFSAGNPLITFTGPYAIYSTASTNGTSVDGILIDTNPYFYFNVMFPYDVLSVVKSSVSSGILNPITIFSRIYVVNYNDVGFYFYAAVLAIAYLLLVRERRAYFPMLWLAVGFLYLEFGPIYISLVPFKYILTHRLDRYLTIIGIPMMILISMAAVRFVEHANRFKVPAAAVSALAVIFLITTSVPISMFWYSEATYSVYDQKAIASYLEQLPSSTSVYMESGFSIMLVYMGYDNVSRIHIYDQISNCRNITGPSYAVIPKYVSAFGLNYTPNPLIDCPYWHLVLYPNITGNYSPYVLAPASPFEAALYYVPASTTSK